MYNQPSSQSPAMFGSQPGGAQMQSAPNLPPGNAPGREYFNHSMATFTNAMQPPTGMVPQGISSLVPGYFFGGGVGYGYSGDESVQASIDAAQADFDAAAEAAASVQADYDVGGGFSQADADAAVAAAESAAESAAAIGLGQTDSLDPSLSSAASQIAAIMTTGNTDGENSGPVVNSFLDTLSNSSNNATSIVPTLGTGGIEGYDVLADSIAQDQDQAAVDSLNDASRGATAQATQGVSPNAVAAALSLANSTGGQTNPTEIDFSTEALNSLQDDFDAQQAEFSSLFNDEVARSSGGFPAVRGTMNPVGDYKDYYDSRIAAARDPEYAKSRQGMYDFLVNEYKGNVVTGGKVTGYEEDGTPIITNELNNNVWNNPDDNETTATDRLNKGFVNSLIKGLTPFQQGPLYNPATGSMTGGTYVDRGGAVGSGLGSLFGPFGGLVGGLLGRGRGGYAPVNSIMGGNSGNFNNPDMEGLPSPSLDISEPDAGDPAGGNGGDNGGDNGGGGGNGGGSGGSDPNTSQYALNPLVYQAYANLGLPVPGNVPPYRRVNIPTSRFVV